MGGWFRPSGVLSAHRGLGTRQGHSYLCPFTLLSPLQAPLHHSGVCRSVFQGLALCRGPSHVLVLARVPAPVSPIAPGQPCFPASRRRRLLASAGAEVAPGFLRGLGDCFSGEEVPPEHLLDREMALSTRERRDILDGPFDEAILTRLF